MPSPEGEVDDSAVTVAALRRVVDHQAELLRREDEVNRILVQTVLAGGSLDDLCESLVTLFPGVALVTTTDGRVVARAGSEESPFCVMTGPADFWAWCATGDSPEEEELEAPTPLFHSTEILPGVLGSMWRLTWPRRWVADETPLFRTSWKRYLLALSPATRP